MSTKGKTSTKSPRPNEATTTSSVALTTPTTAGAGGSKRNSRSTGNQPPSPAEKSPRVEPTSSAPPVTTTTQVTASTPLIAQDASSSSPTGADESSLLSTTVVHIPSDSPPTANSPTTAATSSSSSSSSAVASTTATIPPPVVIPTPATAANLTTDPPAATSTPLTGTSTPTPTTRPAGHVRGSPTPSPNRSPSLRPQGSPQRHALNRRVDSSTLLSAQRTSMMQAGMPHGVLDWTPYDPKKVNNATIILSPELAARQAEVAARKEELLRQEAKKFVVQHSTSDPLAGGEKLQHHVPSPLQVSHSPAPVISIASPSGHVTMSPMGEGSLITSPQGGTRKVPNARTTPAYDTGRDIFGATEGGEGDKDANGKKKKASMESGRIYLAGEQKSKKDREREKNASNTTSSNNNSSSSDKDKSTTLREIRMRTSAIECSWNSSPESRQKPPPPFVVPIYNTIEHSRWYLWCSIAWTIFSLFAHDFALAFLPKTLDNSVYGLLLVALIIFSLEIVANSYCKENYFLTSFMFWLDLIGTFSLCFDIAWINDQWFPSHQQSSEGQVARSASILRLTKFVRILRIIKLVRIVRVFKLQQTLQKQASNFKNATPSKVGLTLSELTDKKVIGMIMLVLVIYPFFSVPPAEDLSSQMGLSMIYSAVVAGNATTRDTLINTYKDFQSTNHIFYLTLFQNLTDTASTEYLNLNNAGLMSSLRSSEYEEYVITDATRTAALARFNHRDEVMMDAVYTLCFTLAVIFIFVVGSFLMNRDVTVLVVEPLDRMTLMVKKLAGTILFLNHPGMQGPPPTSGAGSSVYLNGTGSGMSPNGSLDLDAMDPFKPTSPTHAAKTAGEISGFETEAIEEVIAQMASIFQVVPDPHPHDSHLPKSLAMLSGSKHTQIKTLNSVVQIDVSERPRQMGEDEDLDEGGFGTPKHQRQSGHHGWTNHSPNGVNAGGGGGTGGSPQLKPMNPNDFHAISMPSAMLSLSDFPECSSIEHILHNSAVLPYFKLFMTSNLTLENLLFVNEVDRFRTIMKLHVLNLYNAFISPRAPNQVNLPSLQRDRILAELEHPSVGIFDESQTECINLMSGFLKQFQNSKFCQGYMKKHSARATSMPSVGGPGSYVGTSNPPTTGGGNHSPVQATQAPIYSHNPPPVIGIVPPRPTNNKSPQRASGGAVVPTTPNQGPVASSGGGLMLTVPGQTDTNVLAISLHPEPETSHRAATTRSSTPQQHQLELILPGSIPPSPTTPQQPGLQRGGSLTNLTSTATATAGDLVGRTHSRHGSTGLSGLVGSDNSNSPPGLQRTSSLLDPNRRLTNPSSTSSPVERNLDEQIAALIESEGTQKLRAEREANVKRQTFERAARKASFKRGKSMDPATAAILDSLATEAREAAAAAQQ